MTHRTGSVYIFVLGSCTLAAAAGITAVTLHRQRLERVQLTVQAQGARADAQSALEFALATISQDPAGTTWRSSSTLVFANKRYFGTSASDVSIALADPGDSDLSDSNLDPVTITVAAANGPCEQAYEMTLTPALSPLSCLDFAVVVAGTLTKNGTGNIYTSGTVSTGKAWEVDSDARPDALATFQLVKATPAGDAPVMVWRMPGGGGTTTTTTSGASGLTLTETGSGYKATSQRTGATYNAATMEAMIPNATDTFKHFVSIGTPISIKDIPGGDLKKVVLSPASNPFGEKNPFGVYVIDCMGDQLKVGEIRVQGTLVILNPKSDSKFEKQVCIEPAAGMPAVLVKGDIMFSIEPIDLSEDVVGVNFNPSGSPYDGASDSDMTDVYPSWIRGPVYISGNLTLKDNSTTVIGTVVVAGNMVVEDKTQLRVRHAKPSQAVPGFARVTGMNLSSHSLKRVVY